MSKKVLKYEFLVDDGVVVDIPFLGEILSVGTQKSRHVCLWVLVSVPTTPARPRKFRISGTGHPLEDHFTKGNFVGTVFDGPYVWHVFEDLS